MNFNTIKRLYQEGKIKLFLEDINRWIEYKKKMPDTTSKFELNYVQNLLANPGLNSASGGQSSVPTITPLAQKQDQLCGTRTSRNEQEDS